MGQVLHALGLLDTADLVTATAKDFLTGFVDQAQKTTRATLERAIGKVLFIDEVCG